MDVFVEQLIRKKKDRKDYATAAGVSVLGIVILAISTLTAFLGPFLLIIVTGVLVEIYYVSVSRNLGYEYSTTNGDFTVNQITNRRSRKWICSFDLKAVERMGQYNASASQNRSFARQLMVGKDDESINAWYLIIYLKDSGNTLLVFNPNERALAAIKPFLSRQVLINTFRGS